MIEFILEFLVGVRVFNNLALQVITTFGVTLMKKKMNESCVTREATADESHSHQTNNAPPEFSPK